MTTDYDSVDYFTDPSLVPDPHPYYDHVRAKDPVCCPINNGVLAVTGWESANNVYKDTENYSSCVAVMGPFTPIPFTPQGDDICGQLEEHRTEIIMHEHMVTMDPPHHTDARSVLSRLLTPKRLKENEDFMWRLADRHIDEFVADGSCEFLAAYAKPFSLLVVADLLGVPANRDPKRFDNPHEFSLDRKNVREHIAFSRGIHSCPGAPLARVEGRVSIERILDRLADITVSEERHGPIDARRYEYEPTFILRGLTELNIEFTPAG